MSQSSVNGMTNPTDEVVFPLAALKALAELPGIACGTLSPLARMRAPGEAARRDLMISIFEGLSGEWEWSVPSLIDPKLCVAVLLGDGDTSLLGQYLWPDADARGPGFKCYLGGRNLCLAGPLTLEEVQQTLQDFLSLGGVAEMEPVRLYLAAEEFWALLALADAYRAALLRRRLAREGGRPIGVACSEVLSAWETGLGSPNPGWAVSLFSLLASQLVPQGFQDRIPQLLASMARAELLEPVSGDGADPRDERYVLGDAIDLLCQGLSAPTINFGLAVQRQRGEQIESTLLGGWRTTGGVMVADLSEAEAGRVDMLLAGPHIVVEVIESVLSVPSSEDAGILFSLETAFSRSKLLEALKALPRAESRGVVAEAAPFSGTGATSKPVPQPSGLPAGSCPSCGAPLKADARFCAGCGARVAGAASTAAQVTMCAQCGARNVAGSLFCRECGARLA